MEAGILAEPDGIRQLGRVDWSFLDEPDAHPLHRLHPYPAKFVPALPRRVIAALTDPGDLVMDPFLGSGTTLVEALLAGRQAVGGDVNPVALVTARAKTRQMSQAQLRRLAEIGKNVGGDVQSLLSDSSLRMPREWEPSEGRRFKGLKFWFSAEVARELAALRMLSRQERDGEIRTVLEMCLSAIVVAVSWQDSDTRYVRRAKQIDPGDPTRLFQRRLADSAAALADAAQRIDGSAEVFECDARTVDYVAPGSVRLAITSPPYPNAWSYHLYHQNRILWLDGDPWAFKAREIGHHRSYSAAAGEGEADFRRDMQRSLEGMRAALRPDGHVVVVVGDSIVRGEVIRNDGVITHAASDAGLRLMTLFNRVIDPTRKAFNPSIGKIKNEHVLVFAP